MKLFTELSEDVSLITEGTGADKKLYIEGIYLQSGIKNKNNRIYPPSVMENECGRYIKESVSTKRAWGELGHPNGPKINEDRICHRIVELRRDGNNWIGKSIITETPMGNIVKGLMDSGGQIGVSSRGLGTLKQGANGISEVQDDFRLATAADVVLDPSAPEAFVNGIMESVDWIFDERMGWKALDIAESIQKEVHRNYKQIDEAKLARMFNSFITKIGK